MADKKLERRYLNRAFEILGLHPSGEVREAETPDFLTALDGETLGVEVTTFHLSEPHAAQPHRARVNMQQLAVEQARRAFRGSGGHALYVTVFFASDRPLTKARAYELGPLIAHRMASVQLPTRLHDGGVRIDSHLLPSEIATIHVNGSVDGSDELWHPAMAGWVAPIARAEIDGVIAKKAERLQVIRTKCSAAWLLIVNDDFRGGAPCELSQEALLFGFRSPFDRTLWLDLHRTYDLVDGTVTPASQIGQ